MEITIIDNYKKGFYDKPDLRFFEFLYKRFGIDKDMELNLMLCDDNTIRSLNKQYRLQDVPTDVLSFFGFDGNILGDIVISVETLLQDKEKVPEMERDDYFLFIVAHGFLHLLGIDHQTEQEYNTMIDLQYRLIEEFKHET